jgi:hypothetical protein
VDGRVLEAVPGASRDEDEIARAGDEGAGPVEDLELAGENIPKKDVSRSTNFGYAVM